MSKELDAYFEDHGDVTTVFFNSDKAKTVARQMFGNKLSYKGGSLYMDFSTTSKSHIIIWLVSNNLSSETV